MHHPRPGTFGLQVRFARPPQAAQGHHLAVAKHDVLQPSKKKKIIIIIIIDCQPNEFIQKRNFHVYTVANLETLPVHQLRGTFVSASRGQGIDAQPPPGSDHVPVPEERQAGKNSKFELLCISRQFFVFVFFYSNEFFFRPFGTWNQKENEQKRRRKSKAQFFEMIREVRRCQQEEKETEAADDGEEDEEEGYDHRHRVAEEETGEGVGDDDEEEEEGRKEFRPPPPPADYGDDDLEEEESIRVVVVRNRTPSSDDVAHCNAAAHQPVPRVRHSVSNVTDPGGFSLDPHSSIRSTDSERKWKFQMTKRRRSFSADALCEPAHVHHQRRRQGSIRKFSKKFSRQKLLFKFFSRAKNLKL